MTALSDFYKRTGITADRLGTALQITARVAILGAIPAVAIVGMSAAVISRNASEFASAMSVGGTATATVAPATAIPAPEAVQRDIDTLHAKGDALRHSAGLLKDVEHHYKNGQPEHAAAQVAEIGDIMDDYRSGGVVQSTAYTSADEAQLIDVAQRKKPKASKDSDHPIEDAFKGLKNFATKHSGEILGGALLISRFKHH